MTSPAKILPGKKTCTGCMACVDSCKPGALISRVLADGHLYPVFKAERCNHCGNCTKTCPVISGLVYRSEHHSKAYAVWANNAELRGESASGGAFAAIAARVLSQGGAVVGAAFDGLELRHFMVNDPPNLSRLQGTKYAHSNAAGCYEKVKEALLEGRQVFFTGLPCQVAGLRGYLMGKEFPGLFTADLICAGVPSSLLVKRLNEKVDGRLESLSYRNKSKGWLNSKNSGWIKVAGKVYPLATGPGRLVSHGFFGALTNRYSCYSCMFAFHDRKADLTLADFWGFQEFPEQLADGVSLVLCHSDKGEQLLLKSEVTCHPARKQQYLPFNPRLVCGKRPLYSGHPARVLMPWLLHRAGFECLLKIFAGHVSAKNLVWLPYKIFNFFVYKVSQRLIRKALDASN